VGIYHRGRHTGTRHPRDLDGAGCASGRSSEPMVLVQDPSL
jgi:hypothetical protein